MQNHQEFIEHLTAEKPYANGPPPQPTAADAAGYVALVAELEAEGKA